MIYFVSDTHLGLNYHGKPAIEREKQLVRWLESVEDHCDELFLVGDIFDYWFEYKRVIPKGFTRLFGQLARMSDHGVKIRFFAGNHDLWVRDYFAEQFGASIYTEPTLFELQGKQVVVTHGDGLGKRDFAGRVLSSIFRSRSARWVFQRFIHPDVSMRFGQRWSSGNRKSRGTVSHVFRGLEEPVARWALEELAENPSVDYFVMGHLHTPVDLPLNSHSHLVVLGEWIEHPHVAVMDGGVIRLVSI